MAEEAKVVTEDMELLGHALRVLIAKAFGDDAKSIVTSRNAFTYRHIAREFFKKAHIRPPKKIVRGRLVVLPGDGGSVLPYCYIEVGDGSPDVDLSTFGKAGDVVEIVQVEPER